jgi:hypothetical protein
LEKGILAGKNIYFAKKVIHLNNYYVIEIASDSEMFGKPLGPTLKLSAILIAIFCPSGRLKDSASEDAELSC